MGTRSRDAPGLEEDDLVGLVEHERARADDDGRPAGACLAKPTGDSGLGVGVDGARRLDEDEDLGVGEQRPRKDDPLALAAGERATPLLDVAVEPMGQRVPTDRARGAGCRKRGADRSR